MSQGIYVSLIYNAALLLTLGMIFDSIAFKSVHANLWNKFVRGISLGVVALAIMSNPWVLETGLVFDTRSILFSMVGLFFGVIPAIIATIIAIAYRIWQGGSGVYMGVSVVIASVLWGFLWKKLHSRWKHPYGFLELYSLGIVNHITMLTLTLALPRMLQFHTLQSIALPVIIIYPLATVVLGQIMARKVFRKQDTLSLEERESEYRSLYENAPIAYQSLDQDGKYLAVNKVWLETMGYHLDEVLGHNFAEFLRTDFKAHFAINFPNFKARGAIDGVEFVMLKKDSSEILVSYNGKIINNEDGSFKRTQCVFKDITLERKQQAELRSIEWMLTKQPSDVNMAVSYGDLTELNTERLILDSVGKEVLNELVNDYLSLLDTSSAVYEKNGDYAVGIFSSSWCQYLDTLSRGLCNTEDNAEALNSGKWLCHESCWTDISQVAIASGEVVDKECSGGLHIYAVPIVTSTGVIGAINMGYGTPPPDQDELRKIADKYGIEVDILQQKASEYPFRPAFIIEQAKQKLHTSAKIIAEIVERKQAEQEVAEYSRRLEILREIDRIVLEGLSLEQISQSVLIKLHELIPAEILSVNRLDGNDSTVVAILMDSVHSAIIDKGNVKRLSAIFSQSLKSNKIVVIDDLQTFELDDSRPTLTMLKQAGMGSVIYAPLVIHDNLLGFLACIAESPFFFDKLYQDILLEIAKQLSIAMQQIFLMEEITKQNETLEQKIAERTSQLQISNTELEAFSYSVAHDLRAPLRSIGGFSSILAEDYAAMLDSTGLQLLNTIKNSTDRMDTLITELLELAKLSRSSLKPVLINMKELVYNEFTADHDKEVTSLFDFQLGDIAEAHADKLLMGLVWQNLIDNAIKFSMPQSTKRIVIKSELKDNEVIYSIQDFGVGFDMKYVDKVFGLFQRLHKAEEFEGTGVGLAIVHKVITRHNGRLWVESELGVGTTFYFTLPIKPQ